MDSGALFDFRSRVLFGGGGGGFLGGGGYTITLTDENTKSGEIKYSYCHCDPNLLVSKGDYVLKRTSNRLCWPKICLWSKRKYLSRLRR